jgi:hypothetical protein
MLRRRGLEEVYNKLRLGEVHEADEAG